MSRIYVGNLSSDTNEAALQELLSRDGRQVTWLVIKKEGGTGPSRGFAFADLGSEEEAAAAIAALNGKSFEGREIKVNHAFAEKRRPHGSDAPAESYGHSHRPRGVRR